MAGISLVVGDFDGALRAFVACVEEFRGHDEPYWTTQLAFVQGEGERAALLAGAAEGLRQRVGLRAWPLQQQGDAQLVAAIRQALGADRFDQDFAAGVRLDRQQAIAAARESRSTGAAAS
jgi:hypothetical protein